jgi:hypothetical protein
MTIALIVLASLASIILINALPLIETFKDLLYFQKETIKVISKADFSDEKKQKILLVNSGKILFSTLKQIIYIIIAMLPIAGLWLIGNWFFKELNLQENIVSIKGACLTIITFILFYLIKKLYVKFRI